MTQSESSGDNITSNGSIPHVKERRESPPKLPSLVTLLVLLISAISTGLGILCYLEVKELRIQNDMLFAELAAAEGLDTDGNSGGDRYRPRVWIEGKRMETGYLRHVVETFEKLGFQRVNGSEGDDWDVLWSHDYPFGTVLKHQLFPNQRVNHFPGSGFITNKVSLATTDLKHVPKAFHLPKDKDTFLKYSNDHPEKLWVKKSNDHRGIRVEDLSNIDLTTEGTFVQEFIHNPLLIDGKKFDIGIYVVMTSVEPLRVYFLENEALLRFCAKPYHPFNASDVDQYVVGDDYTPIWEIPSLQKYYKDTKLNMKETLNGYLRSIGKQPEPLWEKIEEAISSVYVAKAPLISKLTSVVGDQRHFFELVRFDFVVDEDLNVYIMEANMSPNLSSNHFAPNKLLYEQVIYNVFSLSGIAATYQLSHWSDRTDTWWNMKVTDNDLIVFNELCSSDECRLSCASEQCRACLYCLSADMKITLKDAVIEHNSRWNMRRLIPSSSKNDTVFTDKDDIQKVWFDGKCLQDISWCA